MRICWFILNKCGSLKSILGSLVGTYSFVSPTLLDGYVLRPFYDVILCILSNLAFISLKYIAFFVPAYIRVSMFVYVLVPLFVWRHKQYSLGLTNFHENAYVANTYMLKR